MEAPFLWVVSYVGIAKRFWGPSVRGLSCCSFCSARVEAAYLVFAMWGIPNFRDTSWGVLRIRTRVYWDLYWGAPILGNYHVAVMVCMVVVYAARPLTARRWTRRHEAARDAGFACACLTWTCASCRGSGLLGHHADKRTAALKTPNKGPRVLALPMHD